MTHIAKNLVAYVMALPVIYQPQYFFFDSPMHHLKYFLSETGGVQRWQQERGNAFQNNPTQCNAMIRSVRQPTIYNTATISKAKQSRDPWNQIYRKCSTKWKTITNKNNVFAIIPMCFQLRFVSRQEEDSKAPCQCIAFTAVIGCYVGRGGEH